MGPEIRPSGAGKSIGKVSLCSLYSKLGAYGYCVEDSMSYHRTWALPICPVFNGLLPWLVSRWASFCRGPGSHGQVPGGL